MGAALMGGQGPTSAELAAAEDQGPGGSWGAPEEGSGWMMPRQPDGVPLQNPNQWQPYRGIQAGGGYMPFAPADISGFMSGGQTQFNPFQAPPQGQGPQNIQYPMLPPWILDIVAEAMAAAGAGGGGGAGAAPTSRGGGGAGLPLTPFEGVTAAAGPGLGSDFYGGYGGTYGFGSNPPGSIAGT